jgi:hypothetical protein
MPSKEFILPPRLLPDDNVLAIDTASTQSADSVCLLETGTQERLDKYNIYNDICNSPSQYLNDVSEQYLKQGTIIPDKGVHSLKREYTLASDNIVLGTLIFCFILIAAAMSGLKNTILGKLKTLFTNKREFKDEISGSATNEGRCFFSLILAESMLLALCICTFIPQNTIFTVSEWTKYIYMGITAAGIFLWIYLKATIYSTINGIFFHKEENKEWISSYFLINSAICLLIFPITLLAVLFKLNTQILAICLLFVLFLCKILLFYKLANNFLHKINGLLFIFLYFCAVEIIPLLLAWHYLITTSTSLTVKI